MTSVEVSPGSQSVFSALHPATRSDTANSRAPPATRPETDLPEAARVALLASMPSSRDDNGSDDHDDDDDDDGDRECLQLRRLVSDEERAAGDDADDDEEELGCRRSCPERSSCGIARAASWVTIILFEGMPEGEGSDRARRPLVRAERCAGSFPRSSGACWPCRERETTFTASQGAQTAGVDFGGEC